MRRPVPRCLAIALVCLFALSQVAQAAPGAKSPSRVPDYRPEVIGDRFRNLPATKESLENLDEVLLARGSVRASTSGIAAAISAVGDQKYFLVSTPIGYSFQVFTLRGIGTYGEVWVQNDLNFPEGDQRNPVEVSDEQIAYLLNEFDNNIYPTEAEYFTVPDTHTGENSLLTAWGYFPPDYYVDGSNRVVILVSNVQDENYSDPTYPLYVAGFYSPSFETYFDRNVMTIDSYDWFNRVGPNDSPWRPDDGTDNDRPYVYEGIFAHEYQHLLHDDMDSDEETWINEGMSMLSELLTGYTDPNKSDAIDYMESSYNSLVVWGDRGDLEILSDYGGAFLMQLYLAQQHGSSFTSALAHNELNGIASVDSTFFDMGIDMTFEQAYRNWTVACLINGANKAGALYSFEGLDASIYDEYLDLENEGSTAFDVLPWGPSYSVIDASPRINNVIIEGISFLPTPWTVVDDPLNPGNSVFFGGSGDEVDNAAILPVDLTGQTGSVLEFKTLFDIETEWDFGFVQVSADGGDTWQSLSNAYTTGTITPDGYPSIAANLPGFTGYSEGWIQQEFDLSAYDGMNILLSFRYMTDWATQGNGALGIPGWYVDDIQVGGDAYDGSSTEPFSSVDEILERFADYMISFVGRQNSGKGYQFQVMHIAMQNFGEEQQIELDRFLRSPMLEKVIIVVSYAAPQGTQCSIPFTYEVVRTEHGGKPTK